MKRKSLVALAAIAGLIAGPVSASAQSAVNGAVAGVQRAAPQMNGANNQLAELPVSFWVFAGIGVIVVGTGLTRDGYEAPKSP